MNMRLKKRLNKKHTTHNESFLQRINHISQPLLLLAQVMICILAYYGYINTVKPVYTKALLEEDIARKQLEIKEKDSYILEANNQIKEKKLELIELRKHLESTKFNFENTLSNYNATKIYLANTTNELFNLNNEKSLILSDLEKVKTTSANYYNEVRIHAIEALNISTTFACMDVSRLDKISKRSFKLLETCVNEASESSRFSNLYKLLNEGDRLKLHQLIKQVGNRSNNQIYDIINEYNNIYNTYYSNLSYFDSELRKSNNIKQTFNSKDELLSNISKHNNIIQQRSQHIIKYYEDEGRLSFKYNKTINDTLSWLKSEFNKPDKE